MTDEAADEVRLSDRDREDVVAQLAQAMSDGRLDVVEFEERSRQTYAAKMPADLDGVLQGLPAASLPVPVPLPPSAVEERGANRRWFFSLLGDRVHRGALDLGAASVSLSLLGDTTFDLSEVVDPTVDLTVFSILGDVTLIVAPGTQVDSGGLVLLGDRSEDLPTMTEANPRRIRFRTWGLIGDIKVRVAS